MKHTFLQVVPNNCMLLNSSTTAVQIVRFVTWNDQKITKNGAWFCTWLWTFWSIL